MSIVNTRGETRSAEIRARLNHPIIDADGHLCEHMPTFLDYLRQTAGSELTRDFVRERHSATWQALSQDARRRRRVREALRKGLAGATKPDSGGLAAANRIIKSWL